MTRRGKTILDDLALHPRRINVIPATVVYFSFKYWIPSAPFRNPLYKSIASLVGVFILFVAAISAFNGLRKGKLIERQAGTGTLHAISWQEFESHVDETYRRKGYIVTETGVVIRHKNYSDFFIWSVGLI